MARINFVELPASDLPATKAFYQGVFGLEMTDFGPTYASTMSGGVDLGLQGDAAEAPPAPLAVILVDDVEAALGDVEQAGGKVVRPIFSFPGGRRFQFRDPSGNELAVMQADQP